MTDTFGLVDEDPQEALLSAAEEFDLDNLNPRGSATLFTMPEICSMRASRPMSAIFVGPANKKVRFRALVSSGKSHCSAVGSGSHPREEVEPEQREKTASGAQAAKTAGNWLTLPTCSKQLADGPVSDGNGEADRDTRRCAAVGR
jgi:hypothetical protein